ncbi:MAG: DUF3047 domain-containing protein [Methylibium sp.]|nr:DUF3047 domain-containing protein [Methylibium sp.]
MTPLIALLLALTTTSVLAESVWVGRFADGTEAWRNVSLSDKLTPTRYTAMTWDGVAAIEAQADASMSLYARPLMLDFTATPVLCWRWRIDAPLEKADLATKAGDDYAARVYVSFSLPPEHLSFGTRTKLSIARAIWGDQVPDAALNYVWDNRYPVGTTRPNAYTDRTRIIVARSGAVHAGEWVTERHDVAADLQAAFGDAATQGAKAVQLALASDTDNTGETARAGFADFHFVAREKACAFAAAPAAKP